MLREEHATDRTDAVHRPADEPLMQVVDEHLIERSTGLRADVHAG